MRGLTITSVFVAGWCAVALANGRPPATSTIHFQQGNPQHVVAGMTFGALFSNDGGQTWSWMCEAAFPYTGVYDPVYAYTSSGAVFATTFNGFKVMRDGCTFNATPQGDTFVSDVVLGSGSDVFVTASAPTDSNIYKSTDDGQTFAMSASPGLADDWWESFVIAPSNPDRVYLSGYRFLKVCNEYSTNAGSACSLDSNCTGSGSGTMAPKCETTKFFLMFRSDDGGSNFTPISQANLVASSSSAIDVVGVDPTNPDIVYVKINFENGSIGDGVYKSTNGGGSGSADATAWSKILDRQDPLGLVVLVRSNGGLLAATQSLGAFSSAGGSGCTSEASCNWATLASPPHINCLAEQPGTHAVWACTQNYGNGSDIPSDGAGIMSTTDLATWTPLLKFQDIQTPVTCGSDTAQAQQCVAPYMGAPSVWCCLTSQLGITSTAIACTGAYACAFAADGGTDAGDTHVDAPKGCCNTGEGGAGFALLAAITGVFLYRRRRP